MTASTRTQGACRACDRYIGAVNVCPYCDEQVVRPRPVRVLRLSALVLATGGLILLILIAGMRDLTTVQVGSLTSLMNHATVRICGTVERDPYVGHDDEGRIDYTSFRVHDGSGWIRVAAYDATARALADAGSIPSRGTRVAASGKLQFSGAGEPKLRLHDPSQLLLDAVRDEK